MDWRKEAVSELREYEAKKTSIISLAEELALLDAEAVRIGGASSDSVPVHGGGNAWEDKQINLIVRRDKLQAAMKHTQEWVRRVERGMSQLSEEETRVLDRFYINPAKGNVDRLCEELCLEKTAVYSRREVAVRHYTLARFGCIET
jgi:hypothetical protein